ncbi:peptidoglycan-binding protein [Bartonella sp. cb54]|uniref:peptidoglycan-binding domain-containing protein n=1 Tax=Bartonella sp. cb54 TaxID=3385560 RepID=UPI0039A55869
MTKKRKTRKKKIVRQRIHQSFVIIFFLIMCRLLFWIAKRFYFYTQKNTLLVVGLLLFTISFGFVSFNALFSQITIYQDVLPQMKFTSVPNIGQGTILFEKEAKFQADTHITSIPIPKNPHQNSSSNSSAESTLKMQKKLAKLGLYDGSLDGIEGPKTRRAIALWKQQTADKMQNTVIASPQIDEIALLIKRSEIEMASKTTKTTDLPNPKAAVLKSSITDIVQVQKALRNFGNYEVIVTGVEDQKTIDALKQFQKNFSLPITGKTDHKTLMKMREVGLLN